MQKLERKRRQKKSYREMIPVKKWFSLNEAAAYMDLSINHFQLMAAENGVTISTLPPLAGKIRSNSKYYLVSDLNGLIDKYSSAKQS